MSGGSAHSVHVFDLLSSHSSNPEIQWSDWGDTARADMARLGSKGIGK